MEAERDTVGTGRSCPECGAEFECRADDVANCQCSGVVLDARTRGLLAKTHQGCLCRNCLEKAGTETGRVEKPSWKVEKPALVENRHYYMEGKYYVFTELYHRQRGYCCENNCRHCPYGFRTR